MWDLVQTLLTSFALFFGRNASSSPFGQGNIHGFACDFLSIPGTRKNKGIWAPKMVWANRVNKVRKKWRWSKPLLPSFGCLKVKDMFLRTHSMLSTCDAYFQLKGTSGSPGRRLYTFAVCPQENYQCKSAHGRGSLGDKCLSKLWIIQSFTHRVLSMARLSPMFIITFYEVAWHSLKLHTSNCVLYSHWFIYIYTCLLPMNIPNQTCIVCSFCLPDATNILGIWG